MKNIETGGPAFARPASLNEHSDYQTAGNYTAEEQEGMDLRDWFAGQYVAGCAAHYLNSLCGVNEIAFEAYKFADAMLKAREQK